MICKPAISQRKPAVLDARHDPLIEALRPLAGLRIALIAPAGGVKDERIDTTLAVLAAAGIDAHLGSHARDHHRYLAGTPAARLADLQWAFALPDVAAVWCLRGGYGSAHIANAIDWAGVPADVPLVGYSDITTLLDVFHRHGRMAIHGPTATDLAMPGNDESARQARVASIASLVDLLRDNRATAWPARRIHGTGGPVSGQLVGGNLTTLASLAGTVCALYVDKPSLLLVEDVGEAEFRLERCLHQIAGSLDPGHLQAVCLGRFERCTLADDMQSLGDIFGEWLAPHDVALYTGLPIGHGFDNYAWRYGASARLTDDTLIIG